MKTIKDKLKAVAFHLPQFHPNALNDELWGAGFSEWRNVVKARPRFSQHVQPKLPGRLGFYDLRSVDVLEDQADLARSFGISAFCFYYYRFGAQRALDRPLEIFLQNPSIDINFLYCWANEPWTRAWDGRSDEVILPQSYGKEAFSGLLRDLKRSIIDPRYFRIGDRPLFLVYQVEDLPNASVFLSDLRDAIRHELGEDLSIGCVYSHGFRSEMLEYVDFVVQFPPHRLPRPRGKRVLQEPEELEVFDVALGDYYEAYSEVMRASLCPENWPPKLYLGVTPDWDNSARRMQKAHILTGSTPDMFGRWVEEATRLTVQRYAARQIEEPVLFVNAWNEWAEGAALEPSEVFGDLYLTAFRCGIERGTRIDRV